MAGILSDFVKKTQQKYKKTNDQIVFDSGTIHDVCSSGSLVIDTQFNGGLAIYGRLVEFLSFESGGKTTLAMQSMREAKKRGIVLLFDNEQAFDYTYANSMGLFEDENFVVFRPRNAEETEFIAEDAIATLGSAISMIVFDSVASTRPKSELERKHGESSQKAEHATFWGNFGNKLVVWASKHHIAVVLINQLRSKPSIGNMDKFSIGNTGVGAGYSNTDTNFVSTGGLALKFQLSARYLLRMTSTLKEQSEDDVTGEIEELRVANVFRIESIKNKCFPPFKREKYVIRFGVGTDDTSIIKDYLTAVGVISTTGSFISYKSDNPDLCFRLNGKTAFNKRFSDPDILEDAKKQFLHYKSSGKEIQIQSNADIWGEGVNTIDDDDGVVEELQV